MKMRMKLLVTGVVSAALSTVASACVEGDLSDHYAESAADKVTNSGYENTYDIDGVKLTSESYRLYLSNRLEDDRSRIVLAGVEQLTSKETEMRFMSPEAILRGTGLFSSETVKDLAEGSKIVVGDEQSEKTPYARFDVETGKVFVSSREIPVPQTITADNPVDHSMDDDLWERSLGLLESLGANRDESTDKWITSLMSQGQPTEGIDEEMTEEERQARVVTREHQKVVYAYRTVNGIRVQNNRVTFSYDLDGKLRKISGQWAPINYVDSQFESRYGSSDEAVDAALDELMRQGVSPFFNGKIRMATTYMVEERDGSQILDMKLSVAVPLESSDGETDPVIIDVDI